MALCCTDRNKKNQSKKWFNNCDHVLVWDQDGLKEVANLDTELVRPKGKLWVLYSSELMLWISPVKLNRAFYTIPRWAIFTRILPAVSCYVDACLRIIVVRLACDYLHAFWTLYYSAYWQFGICLGVSWIMVCIRRILFDYLWKICDLLSFCSTCCLVLWHYVVWIFSEEAW